ncbi:DUF4360 domain-containing protein [Actinomadura terrae]|uniref:DUF4360 domain-containing protein n=1 Tax=Actinomadura terrae TaxID=604353 RepID=UPI001FA7BFB5|nr:DUF4360 domain-containing protein [Actinomadura terrae]
MIKAGSIAALGSALTLVPAPASAAHIPPPGSVAVEIATLNDSGCPRGTVSVDSDTELFRFRYSNYSAFVGQGQPPPAFRKNCQISVKVRHPPEYTYGIMSVEHSGFADIQEGASGTLKSTFALSSRKTPASTEHVIPGRYSQNWHFTEQSDLPEVIVRPCGETSFTTLATELRVDAGTSDTTKVSFMSLDSTDTTLNSTYRFYWLHC